MSDRRGIIIPIGGAEDRTGDRVILKRFVKICGGRDARLAVIPTASRLKETGSDYEKLFRRIGVKSVSVLRVKKRSDCEREDWLDAVERADGVFMTGGHQLRLSTILGGTPLAEAIHRRNEEGMHVAGTSAGAAIMSAHMIAFGEDGPTPRSDMLTLAPGLGLTPEIVVDQHFRQRGRIGRLITALSFNPGLIGVGVDEDTAAFIDWEEKLTVVGSGAITIIDPSGVKFTSMDSANRQDPVSVIGMKLHVLVKGGVFNIVTREASPGVALSAKG